MHARNVALVAAFAALMALTGCGARSSVFDVGGEGGDDPGPDDRPGSCDNPVEIGFQAQTIRGRLLGGGRVEGWCGEFNDDRGREDVYSFVAAYATDVTFVFHEETDFPAVLRVNADTCEQSDAVLPELCAAPEVGQYWTFFAEAGREYLIAIDSPAGTDGHYAFDMAIGWPPLDACPIHSQTITGEVGSVFQWGNTFGRGQGRVDSNCGGPGRENMFRVDVLEPTLMVANINHTGMQATASIRTSCGVVSELACDAAQTADGDLYFEYFFPGPGEYYFVVDQVGVDGGTYALDVIFY